MSTILNKSLLFISFKEGQGKPKAYGQVLGLTPFAVVQPMLMPLPVRPTTLPAVTHDQTAAFSPPNSHVTTSFLPFFHKLLPPLVVLSIPQKGQAHSPLRVFAPVVPSARKSFPSVCTWLQVPTESSGQIGLPWPPFLK